MYIEKKKYVSPEVNVISVDKDVITVSGEEPEEEITFENAAGNGTGGFEMPPVNWTK